jgi:hypothetical protein
MMTLYEQAHFQLDDPVERWIPEWKNMTVREADPNGGSHGCTDRRLSDILTHTSGIGYGEGNDDLVLGERNGCRQDLEWMAKRSVSGRCASSLGPTGCTRTAWTWPPAWSRSCRACRTTSTCAPLSSARWA